MNSNMSVMQPNRSARQNPTAPPPTPEDAVHGLPHAGAFVGRLQFRDAVFRDRVPLVPLLGFLFLGEHVSAARWTGILLIFLGVLLINRTPHRTTETVKSS